ncbi:hypothetical protein O0L34_g9172 [Tuta absoluta]|nr:hypothetical protein O0L34_g9172 [Tuta absoluta]
MVSSLKPALKLAALYLCFIKKQRDQIQTPSNDPGKCIPLHECAPLLAIAKNPMKTQAEIGLMKKSQCRQDIYPPYVYCPVCFTPDAQQGKCVGLSSCPYSSSLMRESNEEINAFVQASKCEGAVTDSVCCSSKPPEFKPGMSRNCPSTVAPPWPRSGCCGIESFAGDRIIGGKDTSIDQYPWMALIEYKKRDKLKLLCGGALISGKYVLTAAHCVKGEILFLGTPRNVRLGEYDISNDPSDLDCVEIAGGGKDCTEGVNVIPIEDTVVHEEYKARFSTHHDIALLRLARMAAYSDFIKPICLPLTDITQSKLPDLRFYVAGWGALNQTHKESYIKQHVGVPYRTMDQCQPAFNVSYRRASLWHGQICAGGEPGKDSCKGDSGGPLMYENGRTFELVGVTNFGDALCGTEGVPGVYLKVYEYLFWIRKNIKP